MGEGRCLLRRVAASVDARWHACVRCGGRGGVYAYAACFTAWAAANLWFLGRRPVGDRMRGLSLGMLGGSIAGNMFCVKLTVELVSESASSGLACRVAAACSLQHDVTWCCPARITVAPSPPSLPAPLQAGVACRAAAHPLTSRLLSLHLLTGLGWRYGRRVCFPGSARRGPSGSLCPTWGSWPRG